MPKTPQKKTIDVPPVRSAREPLRDLFIVIAFGMALIYSNHWFTIIDDETLILSAAAQPIRTTIALFRSGLGQHHHPPLYDLLLHFWLLATGGAFDWLRVPAIVFFVAGIWVLSLAAKRLAGQSGATALILLAVLWPYGFHFGRLAAWYSFAFLLVSALTWAYLRYCDGQCGSAWALVCLFALLLVYTSYFGWAMIALLAADDWWRHRAQPGTIRRLAASAAILAVAYAPLWRVFFSEVSQAAHVSHSWRGLILNAGYNAYVLIVSESLAPWFWRFGVPATIAVASCFVLAFFGAKDASRRFLIFAAILFIVMAGVGILDTKRLLLIGPWVLLPFSTAISSTSRPLLRRALAVSLLVAAGLGWFGVYSRRYYAAPRFFEPWAQLADEEAGNLATGAGIIGNNPSFFFYLTYALKVPPSPEGWRFRGALPYDTQAKNVWGAEDWIAAGHPTRPQMIWIRGMPGPDTGTPMADAVDWLDHHCGDRNFRFMARDPGYELKQRYFPELGTLAWRIEIHQYDCSQNATPPAAGPQHQ